MGMVYTCILVLYLSLGISALLSLQLRLQRTAIRFCFYSDFLRRLLHYAFCLFSQHLFQFSILNSELVPQSLLHNELCLKCVTQKRNCRSDKLRAFDNNVVNERCLCYFFLCLVRVCYFNDFGKLLLLHFCRTKRPETMPYNFVLLPCAINLTNAIHTFFIYYLDAISK